MDWSTGDAVLGDANLDAPERVEALLATALLDAPSDPSLDRLVRLAAAHVRATAAFVTLVDGRRQFFTSCVGLPEPWASRRETPLSHSFCRHVVVAREPLVVRDAREHPLVCDNLAVPELGVVAYVGHPITTERGVVLGSLAVADARPRDWTADEVEAVAEFARVATRDLVLGRAARTMAALLEHASDGFATVDAGWRLTGLNRAAEGLLGAPRAALAGRPLWDALPAPAAAAAGPLLRRAAAERRAVELEVPWPARRVEVSALPTPGGLALFLRDVTARRDAEERLRESEARYRHQALHDPLTGLANRALFLDRVRHALARAGRDGTTVAVLFLDLDGFKRLNDTYGHEAGDGMLVHAAGRMLHAVRAGDTVARFGGDEFAVLLEGTHAAGEAREVSDRILAALAAPAEVAGRAHRVGASIGVAATSGGRPAADLLRAADQAMYRAKARGGGRVCAEDDAGADGPDA